MSKQLLGMVIFAAAGSLMAAQPSSTPSTGYLGNLPQVAFTLVTDDHAADSGKDHAAGGESHEGSARSAGHESSDKAGMDKQNDKSDSKNDKSGSKNDKSDSTAAGSSDDKGGSKEVEHERGDDAKGSPDKSGTDVSDRKGHDDSGVLSAPIPS